MTKKLLLLTCASGALGLWAGVGHAATAAAAATETSQEATSVTELVVTAEKREQSLQKVPVAISVFTGSQRDTIGINSVQEVTNFAPGFSYDPTTVHAYIRGVGRQSVNVTDDQRVSNYEDGYYVYSPYGLDKSSLFLQQEQIERGPQNVGGRNADAGSIDMISVRPTDQPYAELRATVENFGAYTIEGAASGQVAPGLDLRIAGFDKNQDTGYYNNLAGFGTEGGLIHEWYLEGQLDWKPNDKLEFWARTFFEGWNGRGDAGSRTNGGSEFGDGSWDETVLTDANTYVGAGLFVNPNFGYAAPNGNPTANAALKAAQLLGDKDPTPTSVTLFNPTLMNNPVLGSINNFAAPLPRDVKLNNYDDFNYILTYHFPSFDFKYNGGVQGYNYYLNYSATDDNVRSFTLPGNGVVGGALDTLFGGGAFPGCATCSLSGGALPAATPVQVGALVINPVIAANYVEDDWWSAHDINFQSTTDSPLQWQFGGFFYFQHYNQPYEVQDGLQPQLANPDYAPPSALISLSNPICAALGGLCGFTSGIAAPANPHNDILYLDYKFDVKSYAGYGQASWKFNDQLKITGNVRYSYDDKTGTEVARYIYMGSSIIDPFQGLLGPSTPALDITPSQVCLSGNPTNCNSASSGLGKGVTSMGVILPSGYAFRDLGISSSAVTGGAGIEWTPTPDIFTYFRYGRGYESPSFNAGQVLANPATNPEFLNAYEIGYKETFGRNLLIDIAGFYYDYEGLQLPISIANGGVTQSQFINVPKSVSEGVELEAYWTPIKDLLVTFSYSYDHTEILTGCSGTVTAGVLTPAANSLCLIDTNDPLAVEPGAQPFPGQNPLATRDQSVKGAPLPNAPENKLAVDVAYTWRFDPGDLTFSGSYAWRDSMTGTVFNRFYDIAPAWGDLDLRALWKGKDDRYEVIGFIKNVLNSNEYNVGDAGAGLAGSATAVANPATGLVEENLYNLAPPRTFGMEVRYKFF
jgi:iron complex outermembrane receptor protein